MKVVQLIRNWGSVWDAKYVIILHRPFTGHVVPRMRIANFAIFDWNCGLSRKRYEIGPWFLWNVNVADRSVSVPMTLATPGAISMEIPHMWPGARIHVTIRSLNYLLSQYCVVLFIVSLCNKWWRWIVESRVVYLTSLQSEDWIALYSKNNE